MPLQIRRGTEAERLAMPVALAPGELLYTTDDKRIYVGDGNTLGGIVVTGYTDENAQDAAASMLTSGVHTGLAFTYNDLTNNLDAIVDLENYAGPISASAFKGTLVADDSTILVDGLTGRVVAPVFADVTGNVTGDVTGNLILDHTSVSGTGDINITGTVYASVGLGGNLDLNTSSIVGTGGIDIVGDAQIDGDIVATGSVTVGGGTLVIDNYTISQPIPDIDRSIYVTNDSEGIIQFTGITSDVKSGNLYVNVSRGTIDAPADTTAGDSLGGITFTAYHTGAFRTVGAMKMNWSPSAVLGGDVGDAKLIIGLNTNSGNFVFANFDHTGTFSAPVLQTGVYTDSPETRPTGVKGMVIFNDSTGKFQGFNGATWVDLN